MPEMLDFNRLAHSWILYLDDDAKIDQHLFKPCLHEHIHHRPTSVLVGCIYLGIWTKKPKWFRDKWASNQLDNTTSFVAIK